MPAAAVSLGPEDQSCDIAHRWWGSHEPGGFGRNRIAATPLGCCQCGCAVRRSRQIRRSFGLCSSLWLGVNKLLASI